MSKLEMLLLGHFECLLPSGEPAKLPMRKAEALLAYLALAPGIRHPRERLINLLWSDRSEEQARNSLRQCLSTIRKALGDTAELTLQIDRGSVRLDPQLIDTDALEFERLAADGGLAALENAAELYRGEFLEGISIRDAASQEWLESERARFRRQYIEILANLGHTQLASRDYPHAIRSAERLVEQDLLNESGWRLLMRACHANGNRSHALQAFKRCQQVLRDELDVDPDMETVELRDQIARGPARSAPVVETDNSVDHESDVGADSSSNHATPNDHSIAVLPFENMSGDSEQEHFADGITADLVDTLSRFRHLRTVSRYSTQQYKTNRPAVTEIAQQQQVRYVLEGSVRKSGDRIRVNAELIDCGDGQILWSERYDRDLDDLFAVQDELTQSIALAMKVQLDDGDMARSRSRGSSSIKAWELTLAAVDLQDTYVRKNILEARALAEEAIRLDPDYAYAWVSLGWTHWQEIYSGWDVSIEKSIAAAEKALARARAIDPEYAEAYSFSGLIQLMKHDPDAAIRDCLKAVELEPGNAEVQALAAFAHVFAGDYENGRYYEQQVRRLCPVRANWYYLIDAQIEVATGNFARAAEIYRNGLAVEPESPLCRFFLVDLMMQMGDGNAARRYADEIRALDRNVSGRGIVLTYSADPALRDAFSGRLSKFELV